MAAWGDNANGQLGNGSTLSSDLPVAVTPPENGGRPVAALTGSSASHALSIVALPLDAGSTAAVISAGGAVLPPW